MIYYLLDMFCVFCFYFNHVSWSFTDSNTPTFLQFSKKKNHLFPRNYLWFAVHPNSYLQYLRRNEKELGQYSRYRQIISTNCIHVLMKNVNKNIFESSQNPRKPNEEHEMKEKRAKNKYNSDDFVYTFFVRECFTFNEPDYADEFDFCASDRFFFLLACPLIYTIRTHVTRRREKNLLLSFYLIWICVIENRFVKSQNTKRKNNNNKKCK